MTHPDFKLDHVYDPVLQYHQNRLDTLRAGGDSYHGFSPKVQLQTYGTVYLDVGRQAGQSQYIARSSGRRDIIFCKDITSRNDMRRSVAMFRYETCTNILVLDPLGPPQWDRDFDYKDIWITDGLKSDPKKIEWLQDQLAGKCNRFILIG